MPIAVELICDIRGLSERQSFTTHVQSTETVEALRDRLPSELGLSPGTRLRLYNAQTGAEYATVSQTLQDAGEWARPPAGARGRSSVQLKRWWPRHAVRLTAARAPPGITEVPAVYVREVRRKHRTREAKMGSGAQRGSTSRISARPGARVVPAARASRLFDHTCLNSGQGTRV